MTKVNFLNERSKLKGLHTKTRQNILQRTKMIPESISRITVNANAIEKTLTILKREAQEMKRAIFQRMLAEEKEKNKYLKTEVDLWKTKLELLETQNGKNQIPVKSVVGLNLPSKPNSVAMKLAAAKRETPVVHNKNTSDKVSDTNPQNEKKAQQKQQKGEPPSAEKIDVSRLDFRIGCIVGVKKHPDADSLYVEEVELAEEKPRTVVSGLVKHVPIDEMQNRLVVLLCNLKPAKMRGVLSEAMVMCASSPDKVEILIPPEGSCPGDRIQFEGFPGEPDQLLNPKKKIFEQVALDLTTDTNRVATYKGVAFTVVGKGVVYAPTLTCTNIK